MGGEDQWIGSVVKKRRALLDGSNLYRRVTVRIDGDRTENVKVDRALWKELMVGDRLVKDAGGHIRRA